MLGGKKRTYISKERTGVNMNIHEAKPDYEKMEKDAKLNKEKHKEAKTCIGCKYNDKGFCRYASRWCSKVRLYSECSYREDAPERVSFKDPMVTEISGWGTYVKTNKHKPWDMPL